MRVFRIFNSSMMDRQMDQRSDQQMDGPREGWTEQLVDLRVRNKKMRNLVINFEQRVQESII